MGELRVYSFVEGDDDPQFYAWRIQTQSEDGTWHDTDIHGESNFELISEMVRLYNASYVLQEMKFIVDGYRLENKESECK